ncbi:unnamed protein product, partial [Iphiclides podalirius]
MVRSAHWQPHKVLTVNCKHVCKKVWRGAGVAACLQLTSQLIAVTRRAVILNTLGRLRASSTALGFSLDVSDFAYVTRGESAVRRAIAITSMFLAV